MPNVEITNAVTGHIQGDNDDEKELLVDDRFELQRDRQMFRYTCDRAEKVEPYCGNEGGDSDTFYYAAAIVISPIQEEIMKA